jgi:P27 family predicted phage terminase small subunit
MEAQAEWHRLAQVLNDMGVLTIVDRAALAAYCQSYGRWVEAEEKLAESPMLFKTPSGYPQQSPWLSIANKQMELMARYMAELGLTPAARSRIVARADPVAPEPLIVFRVIYEAKDGKFVDKEGRVIDRTPDEIAGGIADAKL